jgi:hyperosmotically inducible protein
MKLEPHHPGLAAAAVAIALVVAGCSDDPRPKPAPVPTPKSSTAPPAPETQATPAPVPAPDKPVAGNPLATGDRALADKVKAALTATPELNAHRIDVTARNGTVTLFGTAETKAQREAAAKAAGAVAGVGSVENKLAIVAGS